MEASKEKSTLLNDEQRQAVEHTDGPLLVVAGAGTGKTRVIIERLGNLIDGGVPKKEILCLTFTEKAAQEMLDRASEKLQESYGVELNIYTFNGFGSAMLSEFAIEIGMSSNLRLVGDNGKVVLLREHLDDLGLDYFAPISKPDKQLADIADYFSRLKQQLVKPADYTAYVKTLPISTEEEKLDKQRHQELSRAFDAYLRITKDRSIIDYDDQLYLLIDLLEKRPNVLKALQKRYRFIMVDEFQDTNPMQSRLIDLLAGDSGNIFVVGDDDQSIYGWRGATLANILDFTRRYPDAKEITLIKNYRSTQSILDGAWRLIQNNNPNRLEAINNLDKRLIADRGAGITPEAYLFSHLDAELNWVAEDIKTRIQNGTKPGNIVVLARSKRMVAKIHGALEINGVEHTVSGVTSSLYRHPVVASLLEALRAVTDTHNQTALYHTLGGLLFSIDNYLLSQLATEAKSSHKNFESLIKDHDDPQLQKALAVISAWRDSAAAKSVREMGYDIITASGYKDKLYAKAQNDPEAAHTVQVLGQWFSTLQDFELVSTMPTSISYLDNLPALEAEGETIADDTINIVPDLPAVMTVHKSKGLEWPVVYIVDCTQGSFPLKPGYTSLEVPAELSKTSEADGHYAEERRLMYVAATRAKDELIMTYSESHNGITKRKPSQFIDEFFGQRDSGSFKDSGSAHIDILPVETKALIAVKLPGKMHSGGKIHLTASQADDYLACPLNFYYKHVLCIPEPPSANTKIGSLFHTFLQEINLSKLEGKPLPELEPMLDRLHSEWPEIGFSSKAQRDRAYNFSKNALKKMYERLATDKTVPIEVETPFNVQLPGGKLVLNGRIDVIIPVDGGVEIRDYKTSSGVDTPERAKSRVSSNDQLTIYSVAWRHLRGEDPVQVCLDFVQTGQIGTLRKRATSLDTMEKKLVQIAEDILSGNFPPGNKHDFCIHPLEEQT